MSIFSWASRAKQRTPLHEVEFAIVDVETTGLFPRKHDRVIEIAAIRSDVNGKRLGEYWTLVNPDRDVGPTRIHGIMARDLVGAPKFVEIAGDVISLMAGAIFVAHNVQFDYRFVSAEVARLGHELPDTPALCTMTMAQAVASDLPGRKLAVCCRHFGIDLEHAHSAYADACATAHLFAACFSQMMRMGVRFLDELGIPERPPVSSAWPRVPITGKRHTRELAAETRKTEGSYIARMVSKLPLTSGLNSSECEYMALLDQVLEDRRVTPDEAEELFELAKDFGISRDQVLSLHRRYLSDLIRTARADSVITENEERDLQEVRAVLSLSREDYCVCLEKASAIAAPIPTNYSLVGKSVCFTGELVYKYKGDPVTRSLAESLASEKGLVVRKSVTRNLDFLVVADADSMSSKAKRARAKGVRILAEPVFWKMLGVDVD